MADYCGFYGRRYAPDSEREDVLGDFLEDFEMLEAEMGPFMVARLGICEGHGTGVQVLCDPEGRFWLEHVPLGRRRRGIPGRVEIPGSSEALALPAPGELESLVLGFTEEVTPKIPAMPRGDAFWSIQSLSRRSAFKLRRLRDRVDERARSSGARVPERSVVVTAPAKTPAEMAAALQVFERAVRRRFRTLAPSSLVDVACALRFVVPQLEALDAAVSKRASELYAEDYRKRVAEKQAENAAIRAADEAWRQEYLAERREKRLAAMGRKPKE